MRNGRNGNPTAVPHFRSGRRSPIFAGLTNKGKVGVQRGRETAGVPSFLLPRRAPQSPALRRAQLPAEVQRKTLRPSGANPLTQFEYPAQPVQRKEPPRQGEHACGSSSAPLSRCREKGYRPLGANRLCGSCTPVSRCRIEKKPIFNRKNLRKPAWTDCLSHLYLL